MRRLKEKVGLLEYFSVLIDVSQPRRMPAMLEPPHSGCNRVVQRLQPLFQDLLERVNGFESIIHM